jgi:hypothetical protein
MEARSVFERDGDMWFCFDGESFETFATETEAKARADESLDDYRDDAADGWPEESMNVCWGQVVQNVAVTSERPKSEGDCTACDVIQERELVGELPPQYRCRICGGLVHFDGTAPEITT